MRKRSLTAIILTTNNELMKRKFIIAAIAVAAFIGVQPAASAQKTSKKAQEAVTAKIIEEGTDNNQTMVQLDYLANRFGGRIVGSPNYTAATYWCADQFRKWGFDVEVQEVGEVPLGFNRGPWSGRIVGIGDSKTAFGSGTVLHFTTPSYTSGTKGVQRGHVVREPLTTRDFERMKGRSRAHGCSSAEQTMDGLSTGARLARTSAPSTRHTMTASQLFLATAQKVQPSVRPRLSSTRR